MAGEMKVQRTYSDPDLPQLLPLPVRPFSSYESRPKVKEHSTFSKEEVRGMMTKLGLDSISSEPVRPGLVVRIKGVTTEVTLNGEEGTCDRWEASRGVWIVRLTNSEEKMLRPENLEVLKHPDFRWVIRDCLLALRDEGWKVKVHDGDIEYVSAQEESKAYHPIVEAHEQMAKRLLAVQEELKMKKLHPHYRIQHMVYLAIMGEKDVRRVCTPTLIEALMKDLDVNSKNEIFLLPRIKVSIEDCYFRMKKNGGHTVTIENCIDVESLVVNLELDRVGFMKKISPSGLLYCVECQTALGDVVSAGCHDVLCNACAVSTHSSGNRQDSPMVFIEQAVCAECASKSALVRCQDCVELFCYDCFKQTHSRGKRQRHCVSLPQRTFCFECDGREASYICVECEDALCTRCSSKIHRSGARQNHSLFGLRKAAYNKKLFADNLDRLMGILQRNVERSYSLNPWFIFYNEALAPQWYNFATHDKEPGDPNDLMNPPIKKIDEDDMDAVAGMTADDQLLQGLPGTTLLSETAAARCLRQGACFDVPPRFTIKMKSPMQ
jgi:hypothetical protein